MTLGDNDLIVLSDDDAVVETPPSTTTTNDTPEQEAIKRARMTQHTNLDFSFFKDQILQPIDDEDVIETGSYTWEIKDFRGLREDKERSPIFTIGGYDFNILLFPKGNANNNLGLYLEPVPKKHLDAETGLLVPDDPNWYVCAQFTLIISSPKDSRACVMNTSQQRFSKNATDWGFSNFTPVSTLYEATNRTKLPLMFDNKVNITAYVKVLNDTTGVLWHNFLDYDSKKETGMVGFINQAATCYLNSLLQNYFWTKAFRKAVYQIPTEGGAGTAPYELQRIFYELQRSDVAVQTNRLTDSFGWTSADAFQQHDVQELNRVLMDKLESSMKGTSVENMLNETFVGRMKSFIKCINVDYESSREEEFWDIQLNVKGSKNLEESFEQYIEMETLEGENKYSSPNDGLQDANKGVIFTQFPNVLHLQLKRFEMDWEDFRLTKINDRHEFPPTIDLGRFTEEKSENIYDLHGVLVHQGTIETGHYYTIIRPSTEDQWYRFDDDRVWKVTKSEVFKSNYGSEELTPAQLHTMNTYNQQLYATRRATSAYMLVYIKRSEAATILADVPDSVVPRHIVDEVEAEIEEEKRLEQEERERAFNLDINIFTDDLFRKHQGFDLAANERFMPPELFENSPKPTKIRMLRDAKFSEIYALIEDKTGIAADKMKIWSMTHRRNHTLRPSFRLEDMDDLTLQEVYDRQFSKKHAVLNIWIEEPSKDLLHNSSTTIKPPSETAHDTDIEVIDENLIESPDMVLFIKYFDVEKQALLGLAHIIVSEDDKIETVLPSIKSSLGLTTSDEIEVFEEVSPGNVDVVKTGLTFYKAELGNGDILTIQKKPVRDQEINAELLPFYKKADDFYKFLATRRLITIKPLESHNSDDDFVVVDSDADSVEDEGKFTMWISTHASYEELATRIGTYIKKDPSYLRVFVNYSGNRVQMRSNLFLGNVLPKQSWTTSSPVFEYELLNIPFAELESMTSYQINWINNSYLHYTEHDILMSSVGKTVGDLIEKLQSKVGFKDEDKKNVIIWINSGSRFTTIAGHQHEIEALEDKDKIYAAVLPEEAEILRDVYERDPPLEISELKKLPNLVPVIQFNRDPRNMHGISFIFALYPNENLKSMRDRMHKKFGLGDSEFAKVKVCLWDPELRNPRELEDENLIPYDEIADSEFLCLNLVDRTSRTGGNHQGGGISIR